MTVRMRLAFAVLLLVTATSAFSPASCRSFVGDRSLPRTLLFSSSTAKETQGGNETTLNAEIVVEEEKGLDAEVAFGAFLAPETGEDAEPSTTPSNEQDDSSPLDGDASTTTPTDMLLTRLLSIASRTGRGEFATPSDKESAMDLIQQLEARNPTPSPTTSSDMLGTWELVYSNTQLFRSSPFFMAGRAVCSSPEQAQQYDWFCDMHRQALAISNIGAVRQVISSTKMISEFETKVGAIPFLNDATPFAYSGGWPLTIDGAIVSTADITPTNDGTAWEIYMDTVEIKGSNLPGIRQALDAGVQLSSRGLAGVLESTIDSYTTPKPIFATTFLSNDFRISRDQDGKVFVYTKVSSCTEPKDYSGTLPDLGVSKLLEGFNDAITKFYL